MKEFELNRLGKSNLFIKGNTPTKIEISQSRMMPGDKFTNVDLWPMPNGDWVVAQYNYAIIDGEGFPVGEAKRISKPSIDPNDVLGMGGGVKSAQEAEARMIASAMDFLEFSWAGKLLAQRLNWRIREEWT